MEPFTHLHVTSAWSLRYGVDHPATLVARAVEHGQHTLALTDRDGLSGAVKHALACGQHGVAPILGVDLAVAPSGLLDGVRTRVGGRARVTVLAHAGGPEMHDHERGRGSGGAGGPGMHDHGGGSGGGGVLAPGAGWAALCHLVSAATAAGGVLAPDAAATPDTLPELGPATPVASMADLAAHAVAASGAPALTVLLGPASEVGAAVLAGRTDLAHALLERWQAAMPPGSVAVEVVLHEAPGGTGPGGSGSGSSGPRGSGPGGQNGAVAGLRHAVGMLAAARRAHLPAVLTHAVRYAMPDGARTADVLTAARTRLRLDSARLARDRGAAHLASTPEMHHIADRIATAAGLGRTGEAGGATDLLADTARLAERCRLDARADLGIGVAHLPEPAVLGLPSTPGVADAVLRERTRAAVGTRYPGLGAAALRRVHERLEAELAVIAALRYPTYFLTVATVVDLVRERGIRVAARGSGAGSLVTYLLGISGVDPIAHRLLMERFLTTERADLPDIDIDVESARRLEVYGAILDRFGSSRVAAVAMADTYRVRQALRDAGAVLGLPAGEIDALAKAFPHLRARDVRAALHDLPELRASGFTPERLGPVLDVTERLDALPRHLALHPCGVLLSDASLRDRTAVQPSVAAPFPMSCFDKDDVEALGLLKLDVLGVRMQSAMAHAVAEVERVEGERVALDDVPRDDADTFRLVRSARTLGCFQIESPGQRELVGRFAPQDFEDLIVDISLFRPGPVKSDMVTPFLAARQGLGAPVVLHESLREVLASTCGVVVFHEQVIEILAITTGSSLTTAESARRAMGSVAGQAEVKAWWRPAAAARGYTGADLDRIWDVLAAFASFGFCKAHAAAFALPTYQSAWLKAHHPAAFLAGVLTHDPGMYPKRLILAEARSLGIAILGVDVDVSGATYRVERVEHSRTDGGVGVPAMPARWSAPAGSGDPGDSVDGPVDGPFPPGYRLDAAVPDARGWGIRLPLSEVKGITDAEVERIAAAAPYADLADLWHRAAPSRPVAEHLVTIGALDAVHGIGRVARRSRPTRRDLLLQVADLQRWSAPAPREPAVQLALDLGATLEGGWAGATPSGLPEMTGAERMRAELDVLGLDATAHVLAPYDELLAALGVTRATALLEQRSGAELLVAGVKVATQTPPIRSGRRVVFLTLDDALGCIDATFFEDAQGPWAGTVFGSWLLLVRGVLRRTGPRGVSLRATGAWELPVLADAWRAVGAAEVLASLDAQRTLGSADATGRRVYVHASGFKASPYNDVAPAGGDVRGTRAGSSQLAPRKLWHSSPGSSGQ